MPYKAKAAIIVPAAGLILGACSSSGGSQTATSKLLLIRSAAGKDSIQSKPKAVVILSKTPTIGRVL
jgi:hypothetical protein